MRFNTRALALSLLLVVSPALSAATIDLGEGAATGPAALQSIGPLAFGPDGILFAADSLGGAIFALDTEDTEPSTGDGLNIEGLNEQVAALLGTTVDDIQIIDLAVNPLSKRAYFSVSRGQGPDALAILLRTSNDGSLENVALDNIHHSRAELPNPPDPEAERRGRSLRLETITDLGYAEGRLLATGLSNEEFSSKFRTLEFPFGSVSSGTSVDIFHGAHGRWETYAPIRTFALYDIGTAPHVLAAYTCTPLVSFPLEKLVETEGKLQGHTVAELGNRNRPLDMIIYQQGGKDYILIANSSRGVMKVELQHVLEIDGIEERIADTAGLEYETIEGLQGVLQLDRYDDGRAVILAEADGRLDLRTIDLP